MYVDKMKHHWSTKIYNQMFEFYLVIQKHISRNRSKWKGAYKDNYLTEFIYIYIYIYVYMYMDIETKYIYCI